MCLSYISTLFPVYSTANYNHGGTKMAMAINNMEKPTIKILEVLDWLQTTPYTM